MPTAVTIPIFSNPNLRLYSLCAEIKDPSEIAIERLKALKEIVALDTEGGQPRYLHVIGARERSEQRHFHVDIATASYFGSKGPPPITDELQAFGETIDDLIGNSADFTATAVYDLPQAEVSQLSPIRKNWDFSGGDTLKVRQTSATLEFEGAPITFLKWRLREDRIICEVALDDVKKINAKYFDEPLMTLDLAFRALVQPESFNLSKEKAK